MNVRAAEGSIDSVENDVQLREQFISSIEQIVNMTGTATLSRVCANMQVPAGPRELESAVMSKHRSRDQYIAQMKQILQFLHQGGGARPAGGVDQQQGQYYSQGGYSRPPGPGDLNAPPGSYAMMSGARARMPAARMMGHGTKDIGWGNYHMGNRITHESQIDFTMRQPSQSDLTMFFNRLPHNHQQALQAKPPQEMQSLLTRMFLEQQINTIRQQQQQQMQQQPRMTVQPGARVTNPNAQIHYGQMGNDPSGAAYNRMPMQSQPGGGRGMVPQTAGSQQVYNRPPSAAFAQQQQQAAAQPPMQQQGTSQQQHSVNSPASSASGTASAPGTDEYRARVAELAEKYLETLRAVMQWNSDERLPEDVRLKNLVLVLEGKLNTTLEVLNRAVPGIMSICERHNQRTLTDSLFDAARQAVYKHNKPDVLRGRLPDVWACVNDRKITVPEYLRRAAAKFDAEEAEYEASVFRGDGVDSAQNKRPKLEQDESETCGEPTEVAKPPALPVGLEMELSSQAILADCQATAADGDTHVFVRVELLGERVPLPPLRVRIPVDYPDQPLAADCCDLDAFDDSAQLRSLSNWWSERFGERPSDERTVSNLVADFDTASRMAALVAVCGGD